MKETIEQVTEQAHDAAIGRYPNLCG